MLDLLLGDTYKKPTFFQKRPPDVGYTSLFEDYAPTIAAIGRLLLNNQPIPSELALSWATTRRSYKPLVADTRHPEIVIERFTEFFTDIYPEGFNVPPLKVEKMSRLLVAFSLSIPIGAHNGGTIFVPVMEKNIYLPNIGGNLAILSKFRTIYRRASAAAR